MFPFSFTFPDANPYSALPGNPAAGGEGNESREAVENREAETSAPTSSEELKAKVVILGAPGVGKTSLIRRYVLNEFSEKYRKTLGAIVYKRKELVPFETRSVAVTITLWDTMGETSVAHPLRETYLKGVQGVLCVCDVTERDSLAPMEVWMGAVTQASGDVPVQILMNKWDLGPNVEVKFAALTSGLGHGAPCWMTSAKSGDNVGRAFHELARRMVERYIVPLNSPLEAIDESILRALEAGPKTVEQVASQFGIARIVADAHLERLRRQDFLRLATIGLDEGGRPRLSYGRTGRALVPILKVEH